MNFPLNNIKSVLIVSVLVLFNLSYLLAQNHPPKGGPEHVIPNTEKIGEMISNLSEDLNLSDDQTTIIKDLYIKHFDEIREDKIKHDAQFEKDQKERENKKNLFEDSIIKELNEDQIEKFKSIISKKRPHSKKSRH